MPKKILPLHEREGLKGIDPDESLEAVLELTSEIPTEDIAELFLTIAQNSLSFIDGCGRVFLKKLLGKRKKTAHCYKR